MFKTPVLIVGGGISGLACAYFLSQRGIRSTLLEKADRVGGLIRTDYALGCDLEAGPDSFLAAKPELRALANALGIENRLISANESRRRVFIGRKGKLELLPKGMVLMAPSDLGAALGSSFFSVLTKLRLLRELTARKRRRSEDVSVARFVKDHFGTEVLTRVAEPLLMGVYGGDAGQLSAASALPRFLEYERNVGSVIRGVQRERRERKAGAVLFQSFESGMQTLINRLSEAIPADTIRCHRSVASLRREEMWIAVSGAEEYQAEHVILALPAPESGRLLRDVAPSSSRELEAIAYSSAILVTLVFESSSFRHPLDGFGFLIPDLERRTIAAATWVNSKFPARVAPGKVAIRSFIVGQQAGQLATASDTEIFGLVQKDLKFWMGAESIPAYSKLDRWPHSMPQYVVGHKARLEVIQRDIRARDGIYLCGNAYQGVGIPDCIGMARAVSDQVATVV